MAGRRRQRRVKQEEDEGKWGAVWGIDCKVGGGRVDVRHITVSAATGETEGCFAGTTTQSYKLLCPARLLEGLPFTHTHSWCVALLAPQRKGGQQWQQRQEEKKVRATGSGATSPDKTVREPTCSNASACGYRTAESARPFTPCVDIRQALWRLSQRCRATQEPGAHAFSRPARACPYPRRCPPPPLPSQLGAKTEPHVPVGTDGLKHRPNLHCRLDHHPNVEPPVPV